MITKILREYLTQDSYEAKKNILRLLFKVLDEKFILSERFFSPDSLEFITYMQREVEEADLYGIILGEHPRIIMEVIYSQEFISKVIEVPDIYIPFKIKYIADIYVMDNVDDPMEVFSEYEVHWFPEEYDDIGIEIEIDGKYKDLCLPYEIIKNIRFAEVEGKIREMSGPSSCPL